MCFLQQTLQAVLKLHWIPRQLLLTPHYAPAQPTVTAALSTTAIVNSAVEECDITIGGKYTRSTLCRWPQAIYEVKVEKAGYKLCQ